MLVKNGNRAFKTDHVLYIHNIQEKNLIESSRNVNEISNGHNAFDDGSKATLLIGL